MDIESQRSRANQWGEPATPRRGASCRGAFIAEEDAQDACQGDGKRANGHSGQGRAVLPRPGRAGDDRRGGADASMAAESFEHGDFIRAVLAEVQYSDFTGATESTTCMVIDAKTGYDVLS